ILYSLLVLVIYNLHKFLDKRNDDYLMTAMQILLVSIFWCILYFFIRQIKIFKFRKINKDSSKSSFLNIFLTFLTPALTYFSNLTIICAGGTCSQVYVSTITSLLGAFGITFTHVAKFMFPITCIMLGISVFSLYIKRKKWKHKPFLLGLFSAILIIIGNYFDKSKLHYLIYPGNLLMIGSAIWNARLNKFYGLPC
ncbi:MAG: hypothetical protein MJ252_14260, partial [archaeon]|nr:hypothetical protein [archaeon]